jgi:hypothetical protein
MLLLLLLLLLLLKQLQRLALLVQTHLALLLVHLFLQPVDLRAQLRALPALRLERPPDVVHRQAVQRARLLQLLVQLLRLDAHGGQLHAPGLRRVRLPLLKLALLQEPLCMRARDRGSSSTTGGGGGGGGGGTSRNSSSSSRAAGTVCW